LKRKGKESNSDDVNRPWWILVKREEIDGRW
jgi:hypothetical protein